MLSYFSDTAVVQGNFRNHHAGYYSIADMAYVVGGALLRELTGALFITAYEQPAQHVIRQAFADPLNCSYVLCVGSDVLSVAIGLNVLSTHAPCTVWSFLVTIVVIAAASVRNSPSFLLDLPSIHRTFPLQHQRRDPRPLHCCSPERAVRARVPRHYASHFRSRYNGRGNYLRELGRQFSFPASHLRDATSKGPPQGVFTCMALVNAAYLSFSLVVYRWCGK